MEGPETMELYRAVTQEELSQIRSTGLFQNPYGIEVKYFSTDLSCVIQYAEMAEKVFGDAPYAFIKTSIPRNLITDSMSVTVDSGINALIVPSEQLSQLSKPEILALERVLENRSTVNANP